MANHKSALKRVRQNIKKNMRNSSLRSRLKTFIKSFRASVAKKDQELALTNLNRVVKAYDKAATKGVLHKKNASRSISRLTKHYNTIAAK